MPENPPKDQYIAVLVPHQDTLENFLETSQDSLREAWEDKRSRNGKEKNSWDKQEEFLISDLMDFKRYRSKMGGTEIDAEMVLSI